MAGSNERTVINAQSAHKMLFQGGITDKIVRDNGILSIQFKLAAQISNCKFECELFINSDDVTGLAIDNSEFELIMISNVHVGALELDNCYIDNLFIGSVSNEHFISVINSRISKVELSNNKLFGFGIEFRKKRTDLNPEPVSKIGALEINTGTQVVRAIDTDIGHLGLSGKLKDDSEIYIENGVLDNFHAFYLNNLGKITLSRLHPSDKIDSQFALMNSSMGEFSIQNINLNKYNQFFVDTTDFSKTSSFNTIWPTSIENTDVQHKIEVFRQLKQIAIREGNKPNEIRYLAKEKESILRFRPLVYSTGLMKNIRNKVVLIKKLKWLRPFGYIANVLNGAYDVLKKILASLSEKLMLSVGLVTNNYGNYWIVPILWLFVMNNVAYNLICDHSSLGYDQDFEKFWLILNPTHSTKFLEELSWSKNDAKDVVFSVDYISRVVNAFLYVQIVAGFRKYSKK